VGKLIALALRFRFLVLLGAAMVVAMALFSMKELPIDAVPDVTPNQVLVLTKARGLSPLEVPAAHIHSPYGQKTKLSVAPEPR
jgi:cobalt-zinc-cadmium resistance protein CzcA